MAKKILWVIAFVLFTNSVWAAGDSRTPGDWFERARADWEVAGLLNRGAEHPGIVCFHAHQAVEKTLKGVLFERGRIPARTHRTADLAREVFQPEAAPGSVTDVLKKLDRRYVPSRYPKEGEKTFSTQDAEDCLQQADQILSLFWL